MKIGAAIIIYLASSINVWGQAQGGCYSCLLDQIKLKKDYYRKEYSAADANVRGQVIKRARAYLFRTLTDSIFNYWYNTPWAFYGQTRIPGQGTIACGYFVTTTLADAGFDIPRIKWAQSASEVFIKQLAPLQIKRFSNRPISEVEEYLKSTGEGLYVVGLDNHTGFLLVRNGSIQFIHSNYYQAWRGVMAQDINDYSPLTESKYRVIGKLLSDEMVVNWILDKVY